MAFVIAGFSGQDSTQSQGLSDRVAAFIVDAADGLGIIDADDETRLDFIGKLQYPVRKGAHMTEYALFTLTVMFALFVYGVRGGMLYVLSVLAALVYAASDEVHQLFVPGRSGQVTDVLIDTLGGILAAVAVKAFKSLFQRTGEC